MWCVWLSSVARSCATCVEGNKDNVFCTNYISRIKRPPPSETISHILRVPDHETCCVFHSPGALTFGCGCTVHVGVDVGAGDVEVDEIYITFIMSVQ